LTKPPIVGSPRRFTPSQLVRQSDYALRPRIGVWQSAGVGSDEPTAADAVPCPAGVRAYVALRDPGSDGLDVLVRSPSGHWLRTWAPLSGFRRFRVKALGPNHPLYLDERVCDRDPERLATELSAAAQHARSPQASS
jgi:hypothetical protein